jgi:hypothetical protein
MKEKKGDGGKLSLQPKKLRLALGIVIIAAIAACIAFRWISTDIEGKLSSGILSGHVSK